MASLSLDTQQDNNYLYNTPEKVNVLTGRSSDVKTVSTISSLSPFLLEGDSPEVESRPSPVPLPSIQTRANLMTLIVDMNKNSPSCRSLPLTPSSKQPLSQPQLTRTPESERSLDSINISDDDNDNDSNEKLPLDKALKVMVKSTGRVLSDARDDLEKELKREYPTPTGTSLEDEDEDLCNELSKLSKSERTFKHEMNFAMDKIAYRHPSTTEWATMRDLITNQNKNTDDGKSKRNDYEESKGLMEKFMEFFCCNHGLEDKEDDWK